MAYTVKQVATMSGVSVRTLHFYDAAGLLKPAFYGTNGYRFYEEQQLLTLQQILFYRELGFELKQIKQTIGRGDFEKVAALRSHGDMLGRKLDRMRTLLGTVEKTIAHLEGGKEMNGDEMFTGFRVAAGEDRFDEHIELGGEPMDCKVSGRDTGGAMCVFEFTGLGGGPRHLHQEQDEWIYVIQGEFDFVVGEERRHLEAGDSIFLPRKTSHVWAYAGDLPGRILNVYQPAGRIEEFFRELGKYRDGVYVHEILSIEQLRQLFHDHGMEMTGPPLLGQWRVDEAGRIIAGG